MTTPTEAEVSRQIARENERKNFSQDKARLAISDPSGFAMSAGVAALIRESMPHVVAALEAWLVEQRTLKAGRAHTATAYLEVVRLDTLAYLGLSEVLRSAANNATFQATISHIADGIAGEVRMECLEEVSKNKASLIARGWRKRQSARAKAMYLSGALRLAYEEDPEAIVENKAMTMIAIVLLDAIMASTNLVETEVAREGKSKTVRRIRTTPSVEQWAKAVTIEVAGRFHARTPLICKPKEWTAPWDGGYYLPGTKIMKGARADHRARLIDAHKAGQLDRVYGVLNHIQGTRWTLGPVADVVVEAFENGWTWAGMPERLSVGNVGRKYPEPFPKDADEEEQAAWRYRARNWHAEQEEQGRRECRTVRTVQNIREYREEPVWYCAWNLDFRGRVYSLSTLSPQAPDITKGSIRFAEEKPLGLHGAYWLSVHTANVWGLDKEPLAVRARWAETNKDMLLRVAEDPAGNREWVDADEPWQALAAAMEWRYILVEQADKPLVDRLSGLPVALDGSCSGLQHYSMLLADPVGAEATNLKAPEGGVEAKPSDIYTMVAEETMRRLEARCVALEGVEGVDPKGSPYGWKDEAQSDGEEAEDEERVKHGLSELDVATFWLGWDDGKGVTRSVVKRLVMTYAYSATLGGMTNMVMEDTLGPYLRDLGDRKDSVLGTYGAQPAARYLATVILSAIENTVDAAARGMAYLQGVTKAVVDAGKIPTWTTPMGLPVVQAAYKKPTRQIHFTLQGTKVSMRFSGDKDGDVDKRRQRNSVAPNYIHSMDAAHLMMVVEGAKDAGITDLALIHDSFGTHAGATDEFVRIIREKMLELYSVNRLEEWGKQVMDAAELTEEDRENAPSVPEMGGFDRASVLEAPYAFA